MFDAYIVSNPIPATNRSPLLTLTKFARLTAAAFSEVCVMVGNCQVEDFPQGFTVRAGICARTGGALKKIGSFFGYQIWVCRQLSAEDLKGRPVFFWIADKMIFPYVVARAKGAKIHYFLMGNVAKEGTSSFKKSLSRWLAGSMARHADVVCVETPAVLDEWGMAVAPERLKTIHLYVDETPDLSNITRGIFSRKMGMVARLTEGKHVVEAIEAVSRYNREAADPVELDIVGDGPLRQVCERALETSGSDHHIRLWGWLEGRQLHDLLLGWDFLLFPTDAEGLPNAVLEAMECGVIPMAYPVGGIRDVVVDGENGFYLASNRTGDLHSSIVSAYEKTADELTGVSRRAVATVKNEYLFDSALAHLEDQMAEGEANR